VLVLSKCDRPGPTATRPPPLSFTATAATSGLRRRGLSGLRELLANRLEDLGDSPTDALSAENVRPALAALRRARGLIRSKNEPIDSPELIALELRRAWEPLQKIERGPLAEEVLESILSRFCIGK
jgi:tRNA U34 5-carboxymethylaminomethyl modifying GTPase MnmE/TrmE